MRMRNYLVLLILLLFTKEIDAQLLIDAGSDNSDIIESSSFHFNGLNGWPIADYSGNSIYANLYEDEYYLIGVKDAPLGGTVSKNIYLNNNRNYTITSLIKTVYVAANQTFFAGLLLSDGTNRITFDITWGEYSISQIYNEKGTDIQSWKLCEFIEGDVSKPERLYNELRVEKISNNLNFYINNHFVQQIKTPFWFKLSQIGFEVSNNTEIAVDYINVLYR